MVVVKVGICCMDVKLTSKPMQAILNRLRRYDDLEIITFQNSCIFEQPVEAWPIVDFFICFYSSGFPLKKAEEYVQLRSPVCINDVLSQHILLDRTLVYDMLRSNGIPVPNYQVITDYNNNHDSGAETASSYDFILGEDRKPDFRRMLMESKCDDPTPAAIFATQNAQDTREDDYKKEKYWGKDDPVQENDDCIIINGVKIQKPFVEKPVYSEDHNIYVYYPRSIGGGSKRLFRKIKDRSSKFYPNVSTVRRNGAYIYENFISTDGADIKVYTVGPDYAHAEARKAPTVDGRVNRKDGKEVRYHVILNQQEKEIARKITQIFGQNVCGFDILRTDGISYVCDVNGWSFVKGNTKYENDCAQIIYEMIQSKLSNHEVSSASRLLEDNDKMYLNETCGPMEFPGGEYDPSIKKDDRELKCVLSVIRHGDRAPKEKIKLLVTHPAFLTFFQNKDPKHEVKLKSVSQLTEFFRTVDKVLKDKCPSSEIGQAWIPSKYCSPPSPFSSAPDSNGCTCDCDGSCNYTNDCVEILREIISKLKSSSFSGINRKVQLKPVEWTKISVGDGKTQLVVTKALLVFKYGGELTKYGINQTRWFGQYFRNTHYPFSGMSCGSLHNLFAHDIKFYTADEGRVQMTAAVFATAFMNLLPEEVIPTLYAIVWNNKRSNELLEHTTSDSPAVIACKREINAIMNSDIDFSYENTSLDPDLIIGGVTVRELRELGLAKIGNPYRRMMSLLDAINDLMEQLCFDENCARNPTACTCGANASGSSTTHLKTPTATISAKASFTSVTPKTPTMAPATTDEKFKRVSGRMCKSLPRTTRYVQLGKIFNQWDRLQRSIYSKTTRKFDVSKVPDAMDFAEYGYISFHTEPYVKLFKAVYDKAALLGSWIVPQEYGVTEGAKANVAEEVVGPLIRKIICDMHQMLDQRKLRTVSRFYFTSESHLNSLCNFLELRLGIPFPGQRIEDYLAHFVFKMYENTTVPITDPSRFTVEIWHSPGSNAMQNPYPTRQIDNFTVQPQLFWPKAFTLEEFTSIFS